MAPQGRCAFDSFDHDIVIELATDGNICRRRAKALEVGSIHDNLEFRIHPRDDAQQKIGVLFFRQRADENDTPVAVVMSYTGVGGGVALNPDQRRIMAVPAHLHAREMRRLVRVEPPEDLARLTYEKRSCSRATITCVADGRRQTLAGVQAILTWSFVREKSARRANETIIMQRMHRWNASERGFLDAPRVRRGK